MARQLYSVEIERTVSQKESAVMMVEAEAPAQARALAIELAKSYKGPWQKIGREPLRRISGARMVK